MELGLGRQFWHRGSSQVGGLGLPCNMERAQSRAGAQVSPLFSGTGIWIVSESLRVSLSTGIQGAMGRWIEREVLGY
jgi:hypothetical protein